MKKTDELLMGEKIIYISTRLFNIQDKMAGNKLEQKVYKILKDCVSRSGENMTIYPLFLPFRDTNEDQLLGCDDAFKIIYEADIQRLERLYALITYLDDPTKDDGICMEIGYAYANKVPIILLSSDVQYYRIDKRLPFHSDPVIHKMAAEYIYMPEIPQSTYEVTSQCVRMEKVAKEYEERLLVAEEDILKRLEPVVEGLYFNYEKYIPTQIIVDIPNKKVFIDIMGGKYEWSRIMQEKIVNELKKNNVTYYYGDRFFCCEDDVLVRGENDIKKLLASDIVAICVDGTEADAGASALIGMAKKLKKTIILYYSSTCDILEGESSCLRNLMIELSADCICSSYEELIELIFQYIK